MMRSLFSGVSGLKTHQTKMDVIGNNIANVNTVGFKSSSTNFSDQFYQTLSGATGADDATNSAGTNAKQIGLGANVAAITTNITDQGGTSTTNRALDVAISGSAFLVVKSGDSTYFTKSGALNVDAAGNLMCTTNGTLVQGWLADSKTGEVQKDSVKDLKVMTPDKMTAEPTATTDVTLSGNVDPDDKDLTPTKDTNGNITGGAVMIYSLYDNLGNLYTTKMALTKDEEQPNQETVNYTLRITDVLDSEGNSIFVKKTTDPDTGKTTYAQSGATITFGHDGTAKGVDGDVNETTGEFTLDNGLQVPVKFNSSTGQFANVDNDRSNSTYKGKSVNFSIVQLNDQHTGANSTFKQYDQANDNGGIEVNLESLTQYANGGTSALTYQKGTKEGKGAGNTKGSMSGIAIDDAGKIFGTYTNGDKKLLGQMAFASFANPSGLEAVGDSLFAETKNSGEFDGVGDDIKNTGGKLTVGALEMSNVDLANEFTQMITTQRGFQANSRIITTSDSMLEELVNLKR
ncbi:MAG: flagellar hook-basal body complex protein [Lachnospiraceae bacterium]|jgi:flagellar hook protein FlgE|nr:flagellar hook-basal body complex protein [Lachnospiraceae bacterium]MEE3460448.1 flagellar hook-basal body complex protein [Lachnospiraceae bacterium]